MQKQKICIIGGGLTGLVTAIALSKLNYNIDLILGVFAALGLGVGFALQDVFKDLISGIIILFEGNVSAKSNLASPKMTA